MWKNILFFTLLLFLVSCTREEPVQSYFYLLGPGERFQEQAVFELSLDQETLDKAPPRDRTFWEHAADECFSVTARKIMSREPLVRPGKKGSVTYDTGFVRTSGEISPRQAALTDELLHEFSCELNMLPHWELSGQIVGFDRNKTVAATNDKVDLVMFDKYPEKGPAYFFIARRTERQGRLLLKIFGSGKILQALGGGAQVESATHESGTLARGMILETRREVLPGDVILLSFMRVKSLHEKEQREEYKEVQVQPRLRVVPEGEKESFENSRGQWRKK
ncbi:hypothetical protein [Desulfonatronospira sp.]|uniref:hypothetical protein n=1 Tax=Desulfonatronospira sp. TaxID=1962951 RepID=UPI0025BDEBC4|nr:hypothetical protein [Desulfonatronospira sp.]